MKDTPYTITYIIIGITIVLFAIVIFFITNENYATVTGGKGYFQKQYNQCINQCNRSDPSKRLQSTGNINCGFYCDSVIDRIARSGIESENIPIDNNIINCEIECSDPKFNHNQQRKCVSVCTGQKEIKDWCEKIECPYSKFDKDTCLKMCFLNKLPNNIHNSWNWGLR